jgi:hypothetical protein
VNQGGITSAQTTIKTIPWEFHDKTGFEKHSNHSLLKILAQAPRAKISEIWDKKWKKIDLVLDSLAFFFSLVAGRDHETRPSWSATGEKKRKIEMIVVSA